MGVRKITIETYVCDRKGCNKESENAADFFTGLPVQLGTAKKDKLVLCGPCRAKLTVLEEEFLGSSGAATDASGEDDMYDPQTDPRMQKFDEAERNKHFQAKIWARGPESTMKANDRPTGIRGPAGVKVLAAYEVYLYEQSKKEAQAKIEAGAST